MQVLNNCVIEDKKEESEVSIFGESILYTFVSELEYFTIPKPINPCNIYLFSYSLIGTINI